MIQLQVLAGEKAGANLVTRRFPVRVGRASTAELQLSDAGVWDQHFRIDFRPREGYLLTAEPSALVSLNDELLQEGLLHNGDIITLGSAKLQFWLAETKQRRLRFRETFTWVLIGVICLLQVALVYLLIRL
jgi:hypothetical protein